MEEIKQPTSILLSRKKLEWIAYNYELTSHAKERIKERADTTKTIKEQILNSPMAWLCGENKYAIALNLYELVIITTNDNVPYVKTFMNLRDCGDNVTDLAFKSYIKLYKGQLLKKEEN